MQLGEVTKRQVGDALVAFLGQLDARDPAVARIRPAADQACRHRAVYQFDRAVRAQRQVARDLADSRRRITRMALDGHQQLVLDMGEPGRAGLLLAPVLETAQGHPEGEEIFEIPVGWRRQRNPPSARSSQSACG